MLDDLFELLHWLLFVAITLGLLTIYLTIGAVYAHKTSLYCYQKARKDFQPDAVNSAYNQMMFTRVVGWLFVIPTVKIARYVKAPVEAPYQARAAADRDEIHWKRAIASTDDPAQQQTYKELWQFAMQAGADAQQQIRELES